MNERGAEIRDEKAVSCSRDSGRNLRKVEQSENQTGTARREDSIQNEALIEIMLGRANMEAAYRKVVSNKGAPGVDGMTTEDLKAYLQTDWIRIKEELLTGRYKPKPVKQVEIPKPDGGVRKLGIPTVIDIDSFSKRFIKFLIQFSTQTFPNLAMDSGQEEEHTKQS